MSRDDYIGIGKRIAAYRKRAGLTARELGERLEIAENTVAKIEGGHRAVLPVELVLDIAFALGVPPTAILFPLGEPASRVTLGGREFAVADLFPWITGTGVHHSEWEDSPAAHGSLMVETARTVAEAAWELEERWGGERPEDDTEARSFDATLRRERQGRKMLAWLNRQLPTRGKTAAPGDGYGDGDGYGFGDGSGAGEGPLSALRTPLRD